LLLRFSLVKTYLCPTLPECAPSGATPYLLGLILGLQASLKKEKSEK